MCVEPDGVPALRPVEVRGPADRIPPDELTRLGPVSYGWVAVPDRVSGPTPIVVLCHERYGVVRHTVELTERFAEAGFVAIAPDFYADMDLTGQHERLPDIGDAAALRHLDAAISHARSVSAAAAESPVAVLGICRTGSFGIVADASRDDIAAVIMLYGGAQPREYQVGELRSTPYPDLIKAGAAPVLGIWGEKDHTMSVEDVRALRGHLEDARRTYEFMMYPDLPHGWLNDTMPGRFRAEQAAETFDLMVRWLGTTMSETPAADVSWRFTSTIAADYEFAANTRLH
ncbi:dienelactone hydrolase family protein [Mycolicibacterium goodii]|uniref:dienelactone hydrolase family protein n=1 Tax=Mycolicibacterium goodii TaxID=134601 RepID=UPI0009F88CE8